MKEFPLNNQNFQSFIQDIQNELEEYPLLIVTTQQMNTGKWGMAKLWRAWMATTAEWMAKNGAKMPLTLDKNGNPYGSRPFSANDAHELFTRQHMGVDENGNRLSWAKSGNHRKATKGERFNALQRHEAWASERGIILFKPRGSEYDQLEQEQNK